MTTDQGRVIEVNGISLYVEVHGEGTPVVLLHGWPDSAYLWRRIPLDAPTTSTSSCSTGSVRSLMRTVQPPDH